MEYVVRIIEHKLAYPFLLNEHYAHRIPSVSFAFGLFGKSNLIGVCTFGTPASAPLRRGICGEEYANRVLELNRLWTPNDIEHNASSYFVSRCLHLLPQPTIIVSYADPTHNHVGYTYQALNFIYTGLSAKRTDWKIKGMEHLHGVTVADISRGQKNRAKYMREKYGEDFYLAPRARKHRYILFAGTKRECKDMRAKLKYPIMKYPKQQDETPTLCSTCRVSH
uniref:Uncharacterized protein n=1 Tax=viral metagenome TaxID=1070528 RepID=A0A6M3L9E8_9ZZZZ